MLVKKYNAVYRVKLYTEDNNSGIDPIIFLTKVKPEVQCNCEAEQIGNFYPEFSYNYYTINIKNKSIKLAADIYSMFMKSVIVYPYGTSSFGCFKINMEIRHGNEILIVGGLKINNNIFALNFDTDLVFEGNSYSIIYRNGTIKEWMY